MGMDVGPKTVAAFGDIIGKAGTIVWNGPMGVFEAPDYAAGTLAVAKAIAAAAGHGASRSSAAATRPQRSRRWAWLTR